MTSALRQNSEDFVFYFLQFTHLSITTKRKVYFPCFISLPKILYSWQYLTSGCAFKISTIVWSTDPVVVVVMWYLAQGKKTPCFNNTSLRTKRNSYNKTSLVKNSQRHKESKRAWLRQKQQTEIERHRKSTKDKPCACSSGDARGWKKCLTICTNIQTGSWRYQLPLTVSGAILTQ